MKYWSKVSERQEKEIRLTKVDSDSINTEISTLSLSFIYNEE